jgi:hypothetical protein
LLFLLFDHSTSIPFSQSFPSKASTSESLRPGEGRAGGEDIRVESERYASSIKEDTRIAWEILKKKFGN